MFHFDSIENLIFMALQRFCRLIRQTLCLISFSHDHNLQETLIIQHT